MRSLCKQWTEGSPPVFAVLDGIGALERRQRAVHHPGGPHPVHRRSGRRSTSGLQEGSPYLWWTGPNQSQILATLVKWGSAGRTARRVQEGGDRRRATGRADQLAVNDYLLPDFKKAGLPTPVVVDDAGADLGAGRRSPPTLRWSLERLQADGVQSVIPIIPFNAFFPYLQAETTPEVLPEAAVVGLREHDRIALGLIPVPFEQALNLQEGITDGDPRRRRRELHHPERYDDAATREPGRLRPRSPELLQHLEGAQRAAEGQVAVHRGAGSDRRLVPGDRALCDGGQKGRPGSDETVLRRGDGDASRTSRARGRRLSASAPTTSPDRRSTGWSGSTTTARPTTSACSLTTGSRRVPAGRWSAIGRLSRRVEPDGRRCARLRGPPQLLALVLVDGPSRRDRARDPFPGGRHRRDRPNGATDAADD